MKKITLKRFADRIYPRLQVKPQKHKTPQANKQPGSASNKLTPKIHKQHGIQHDKKQIYKN